MPLRKFVVEMYLFFFWMISLSVLGENTYFPEKAPFLDCRDGMVQTTDSTKPLGFVCSDISSCTGINIKCLNLNMTKVLISCQFMPWANASKFCKRHGGDLLPIKLLRSQPRIVLEAKRQNNCRKLWLQQIYKPRSPSTASSIGERTIQLTSVTVNVFISTAGQLTITPPRLKTTSNGKSTLIISITVPLGIILVLFIIIALIVYRCRKARKIIENENVSIKILKDENRRGTVNHDEPESQTKLNGIEEHLLTPTSDEKEIQNNNSENTSVCSRNSEQNSSGYISLADRMHRHLVDQIEEKLDQGTIDILRQSAYKPDYVDIKERMKSFFKWNHSDPPSSKDLAMAGFYYTGKEDKVNCFMCSLGFFEWQKNDVPWYQHSKLGSHCSYVKACKRLQVYHITEEMRKGREQDEAASVDIANSKDDNICMKCQEKNIDCLFLPCSHSCCCFDCGVQLTECIMQSCKIPIKKRFKIDVKDPE